MGGIYQNVISTRMPVIMDENNFLVDCVKYINPNGSLPYLAFNTQQKLTKKYSGDAVIVRRPSDQSQTNFGFLNVSGDLNRSGINAWAGIDSVYVVTCYDQMGSGNNLSQSTASSQPSLEYNVGRAELYVNQVMTFTSPGIYNNFTIDTVTYALTNQTLYAESTSGINGATGVTYAIHPDVNVYPDGGAGIGIAANGIQIAEHSTGYLPILASWSHVISDNLYITHVCNNKQHFIYSSSSLVRTGLTSPLNSVAVSSNFGGGVYGTFTGYKARHIIWDRVLTQAEIDVLQFYAI